MTTRSRATALALGFFSLLIAATQSPTQAQPQDPAPTTAKRKYDPSRRVPPYFGQIALSPEQRETIYKIRKAQLEKIEIHKKEIAKLEEQMMTECEGVLTETQKKLLENLRHATPINSSPAPTLKPKSAGDTPGDTTKKPPKNN